MNPLAHGYHFTPKRGWMNDPNGMVFFDGEYHLFFQHHPFGMEWGPMHWGHAVSRDLLRWEHLPIALEPDELGAIFSGSAVIDWHNTAGFGPGAMVAIFTHAAPYKQMQSLAYSTDRGRSWTKYGANPVIPAPAETPDFRDPKVFWYEAGGGQGHWVMVLAVKDRLWFYTSPDLKGWTQCDEFAWDFGLPLGVWETPELFALPVDGGPDRRWVLVIAVGDGGPAGGSGTFYVVGDFDGQRFTPEGGTPLLRWVDCGADFYAPQAWNDAPEGRRVWAAWMNNWRYANTIPATTTRGALTLPRELALTQSAQGPLLVQRPVRELAALRGPHHQWRDQWLSPETADFLQGITGAMLELLADFEVDAQTSASVFGLRLRQGTGEQTIIEYQPGANRLLIDRTLSGSAPEGFAEVHVAPLEPLAGRVRLHIVLDHTSVELFANDGRVVLTDLIFPSAESISLGVYAVGGQVRLHTLDLFVLQLPHG